MPLPHPKTYQVDRVNITVLVLVVGQDLPWVGDVAGRQPERVQLGEFGVRGAPRAGWSGLEKALLSTCIRARLRALAALR